MKFDEERYDQFGTLSWDHFQNGELYDKCQAEKIRGSALAREDYTHGGHRLRSASYMGLDIGKMLNS